MRKDGETPADGAASPEASSAQDADVAPWGTASEAEHAETLRDKPPWEKASSTEVAPDAQPKDDTTDHEAVKEVESTAEASGSSTEVPWPATATAGDISPGSSSTRVIEHRVSGGVDVQLIGSGG